MMEACFSWYPVVDLPTELHTMKFYITHKGSHVLLGKARAVRADTDV